MNKAEQLLNISNIIFQSLNYERFEFAKVSNTL